MEAKFVLTFVNVIVSIILAFSSYVVAKKYSKLTFLGTKVFLWEAIVALVYIVVSYMYLNTIYPQAEYFWYGTYLLYPVSLLPIILFVFYLLTKTFERLGDDEKIGSVFDEE